MDLGVSLGPEGDLSDKIERLPDSLDFVEFSIGEQERKIESIDEESITSTLEKKNFSLIVHLPFRQRLTTQVKEFNDAVLDYHRRLIRFSKKIGARKFVVHADMRDNSSDEEAEILKKQVNRFERIADEENVEICYENIGHWNGLDLFELGELLKNSNCSMCFDTGHAFSEVGQDEMEDFLEEYSEIISHLHLQDTREGRDMHLPIGLEEIDFKPLSDRLSQFKGTATMEIFTEDLEYIELSRNKVEDHF